MTPELSLYLIDDRAAPVLVPCAETPVYAGFPSPAEDYLEERIDLTKELIQNPTATFLARVRGDSMKDAGLCEGDLVIIDRSLTPRSGHMVLAWVDGGFTVKYLSLQKGRCLLKAANPDYPDLTVSPEEDSRIWGVVTHLIRSM